MRVFTSCDCCGALVMFLHRHHRNRALCNECEPTSTSSYGEQLERRMIDAVMRYDTAEADRLADLVDNLRTAAPRLLDAALVYIRWGWPVFPLVPNTKRPLTDNGYLDASTDPDAVRGWWSRTPDANIGIPTGIFFDVIDLDGPDGALAWPSFRESGTVPDAQGLSSTCKGGMHVLVSPTGAGNTTRASGGVDYRGKGGYIVVAPSLVTEKGKTGQYTWIAKPSPRVKVSA